MQQCPKCEGKNAAEIIYEYRYVDSELKKQLETGKAIKGLCGFSETDPQWSCNDCKHKWGIATRIQ